MKTEMYQPKTGQRCHCRPGIQRDNCPDCEGTGQRIDFAAIRAFKTTTKESLFGVIRAAGIKYASHETDLYLPDTAQVRAILDNFPTNKANATRFQNQVEGGTWIDIPFAYLPAWEAKQARR